METTSAPAATGSARAPVVSTRAESSSPATTTSKPVLGGMFANEYRVYWIIGIACVMIWIFATLRTLNATETPKPTVDLEELRRKSEERLIATLDKWAAKNGLLDKKRGRSKSKKSKE